MDAKELPPIDLLRKLLRYEPETGVLFWLPRPVSMFGGGVMSAKQSAQRWNTCFAHQRLGNKPAKDGYLRCQIDGQAYQLHRIAWALHYNQQLRSQEFIDHINHQRSDNRIGNLRLVDRYGNAQNQSLNSRNTSGYVGVHFSIAEGMWKASIRPKGTFIHLGYFKTKEEAISARKSAEIELAFHPNHGLKRVPAPDT